MFNDDDVFYRIEAMSLIRLLAKLSIVKLVRRSVPRTQALALIPHYNVPDNWIRLIVPSINIEYIEITAQSIKQDVDEEHWYI